jgi:hypothetical protein
MRLIRLASFGADDSAISAPVEWAKKRQACIRKHDLLEKDVEVFLVVGEMSDMAFFRMPCLAVGTALAAQIVGRDPQAHRVELADSLEIFLDELIAPLQQHDRAAGW